MVEINYFVEKYQTLITRRKALFELIGKETVKPEWLITRITEHQWSIDEILRHVIASDIRYIQQPIDETVSQHEIAVPAQWVGSVFFRFEELEHVSLEKLTSVFQEVQSKSLEVLASLSTSELGRKVEAPWKQMVTYQSLLDHNFDHELSHIGQVYFILTYFRGPPEFNANWSNK